MLVLCQRFPFNMSETTANVQPSQIYGTKEHPYSTLPETKENVNWADLVSLDLSTFDQPGGKEALAKQLNDAVHNVGFFYIVNFGFAQEEVDNQFALGKQVFDLPFEEKAKFAADHANGGYNGYTGPELPHFKNQAGANGFQRRSNVEVYNIPKFTEQFKDWHKNHPQPIRDNWDSVVDFGKRIHTQIIEKLLVIFAIVLELEDQEYFVKRHRYDQNSEDHLRYMKYKARSSEENAKANGLYSGGHTDLGSVTLLFRQPVAALQVLGGDNEWQWVKPLPGSITVNIADTLQILSGEYLKSSVHRVVSPPPDQASFDRLGVLYFVRPNNDVLVEVVEKSPVLSAEGVYDRVAQQGEKETPITVKTWVAERQKHIFSRNQQERYQQTISSGNTAKGGVNFQTDVAGIKVKYWT
ncbi:isopenicillin n synthase [Phaffia rhodozyma]|uniref:Isopenicillin n synthase n=1 Tax=Phaffia rhodozyma TaxID=264483 RepID=A0A0F7SFF1_PHARH|nr:isopenicillin n synthase [Phaffia rhodozyma]